MDDKKTDKWLFRVEYFNIFQQDVLKCHNRYRLPILPILS